jgi:hypothetical protein
MSKLEHVLNPAINHVQRKLYCYRYYAWTEVSYDEEHIWEDVQRWGGSISIRGDCIDYWVPPEYITFFLIKYPELTRQMQLEYV